MSGRLKTLRLIASVERLRFLYAQAAYTLEDIARIQGPSDQEKMIQTNESVALMRIGVSELDAYIQALSDKLLYSLPPKGSA